MKYRKKNGKFIITNFPFNHTPIDIKFQFYVHNGCEGGENIMDEQNKPEESTQQKWVGRFLNYPPKSQIEFLFRHRLEESIREKIENEIMGNPENEQP